MPVKYCYETIVFVYGNIPEYNGKKFDDKKLEFENSAGDVLNRVFYQYLNDSTELFRLDFVDKGIVIVLRYPEQQ